MNKYLDGYLASIPKSEYENIINFLQEHISGKSIMSEEDFELILNELVKYKAPSTQTMTTLPEEKPVDTYNNFFSRVSVDLIYLFKIIDALYNAIDSYSYLSASYLSDVKSELDKLTRRLNELRARKEYDNNTIIISETFKDTESFEQYNKSTEYLFSDRDGVLLQPVDLIHNNTDDMITLKVIYEKDLLHNQNGKSIGMVKVIDYRGVPIDTYNVTSKAIDNSDTSYWDCSVITDSLINVPMDEYEAGGAYIKFKIYLSKASKISEISITPFCIYPVEICKIRIGDKEIISGLSNPNNISTDTMTFNINPVATDEIEIIMKQKNYVYDVININEKAEEANDLWNALIDAPKESYVAETQPYHEYKDDLLFMKYMQDKEEEITKWNEKFLKEAE